MFGASVSKRRVQALIAVTATVLGGLTAVGFVGAQSAAGAAPPAERSGSGVTADALPTVQIDNGVVWSQVVVGDTVFAGGSFSNARPAGAAAGTNLTPRGNLLAYDITTGNLVQSFAPNLNGQVNAVAASPDGSRIYVGGSFTQAGVVGGAMVARGRIAAYSTATGQLISSFAPSVDASVFSIVATNTTVYAGGAFSMAKGNPRARLAAFDAGTGAVLGWAPTADSMVKTMVMAPNGTHLIVGGSFAKINGATALGLASIDSTNGSLLSFAVTSLFKDYGANGGIQSLSTDGTAIYGAGYAWSSPSNFEGVFSADPDTGELNWLADCHGDAYSTYAGSDAVYVVSHEHDCSNSGGFLNNSAPDRWYRTTAFTKQITGVTGHDSSVGYADFSGKPSPSLINWFPQLLAGTFTGQTQAAWSVTGNSQYVVEGGEFPSVNDTDQYGLVRFGVPGVATNKSGPVVAGTANDPIVTTLSNRAVRLAWQTNWDRDDENLTYSLFRADVSETAPIYRAVVPSQFWNRPQTGYLDTGLTPGATYTYWLKTADPSGNSQRSDSMTVTMPTTMPDLASGQYSSTVLNDGASDYWRLDQSSSATTNYDQAGGSDLTLHSGVKGGATGATVDGDSASTFSGTSTGFAASTVPSIAPSTSSQEVWFATSKTGSVSGGLMSFGSSSTGNSSRVDHSLAMSSGKITFKVYTGTFSTATITSPKTYSDRQLHQAVGTYSPVTGMALYVDGALVASNSNVPSSGNYRGSWRLGGDSSSFFNGTLDDASVYPTVLTAARVSAHYAAASSQIATPPTPQFIATLNGLTANLDASASTPGQGTITGYAWDFGDGSSGSGVTTSHAYAASGSYLIQLTVSASNGGIASTSHIVTVAKPNQPPVASFTDSCVHLACTFDGSGSTDPDGAIASYSWSFGDGSADTGATRSHTYASGGSYTVTLTVNDNKGATAAQTSTVIVAGNQAPTASFTQNCTFLACSFDAAASADSDGSITSYAWAFGDGSTANGISATHTYAAAGTYVVTVTVTDNDGATAVASQTSTPSGVPVYATDTFGRTVASGWGTADVGGSWTLTGGAAQFAVGGSTGSINMSAPGTGPTALLNAVSAGDLTEQVDAQINATPTGNGVSVILLARHTAGGDYRLKLRLLPAGVVHLALSKVVGGSESSLKEVTIAGLTYAVGDWLRVKFTLSGTSLGGKVWAVGAAEPATAQVTSTDASLAAAGSVGIQSYLSGNSTVSPVLATFDNLSVTAPAGN